MRDTNWSQHDQARVEQPRVHVRLSLLDRVNGKQERNAQTKLEVTFDDCPQQVEREQTKEDSTEEGDCTVKLEEEKIQEGVDVEDVENNDVNEPHNRHNNTSKNIIVSIKRSRFENFSDRTYPAIPPIKQRI